MKGGSIQEKSLMGTNRIDYYGAIEHWGIGSEAFKLFLQDKKRNCELQELLEDYYIAAGRMLWLRGKEDSKILYLPVGQIIALAGDFYGVPKEPISLGRDDDRDKDKKQRFLNAFEKLLNCYSGELKRLQDEFEKERKSILDAAEKGKKPHVGLHCRNFFKRNVPYVEITNGRYFSLALKNFDHFYKHAKEAYRIGHSVALDTASHATDPEGLVLALNQELFACHFLTDLFASGHARVPRKELYDYIMEKASKLPKKSRKILAGKIAMKMHDEDGDKSLTFKSTAHPEGWRSYGDSRYYDPENQENQTMVCEAVQVSLQEIYDTYRSKKPPQTHAYLEYLPKPKKPRSRRVVVGDVTQIEGLKYKKIEGLGCCLYEAVAASMPQDSNISRDPKLLREMVSDYIEENRNTLDIRLGERDSITEFIKDIKNGNREATDLELKVLMNILNRPILVLSSEGLIKNIADRKKFSWQAIFLLYRDNHFDGFLLEPSYQKAEKYKSLLKSLVGNFYPMFEIRNETVQMRRNLSDPYCSTYVEDWDPRKVWKFFKLKSEKAFEEDLTDADIELIKNQLEKFYPNKL